MITNLATLLASDAVANHGEDVMFNSEDQIMSILRHKEQETIVESSTQKYRYQDPLIVLWHNRKGTLKWYLGFYLDENDDYTIRVDHLERNLVKDKDGRRAKSNIQWVRPKLMIFMTLTKNKFYLAEQLANGSLRRKRSYLNLKTV